MAMRLTGLSSGLDTDSMVRELTRAYQKKAYKFTRQKQSTEWKQDIWKDLNKQAKNLFSKASNLKFDTLVGKKTVSSNENKATVVASKDAPKGTQTLKVNELAQSGYLTGASLGDGITGDTTLGSLGITDMDSISIRTGVGYPAEFKLTSGTTVNEFISMVRGTGLNASFDVSTGRFFISAKDTGKVNDFIIEGSDNALQALGIKDGLKIAGRDAEIELNGMKFQSGSNNFNINGMSITAKDKTAENEVIQLSTTDNTEKLYDQIKGFLKDYNNLINKLDKYYNADVNNKYQPLVDEEKEQMSDRDIEKWEDKAKESLLRRDGNISTLASAMKNAMVKTYDVGSKKMSLSDFGINTLSYFKAAANERNAFHIDGDADDEDTASATNKLLQRIQDDPEGTAEFFKKLGTELYDNLNKISQSSSSRSFGSFYDDKAMNETLKKQEKYVSDWEAKVEAYSEKYYKQFSKMESMLTKLNSQSNSFASFFGLSS